MQQALGGDPVKHQEGVTMTSINHKQDQTRRSFGDKWNNNPGLLFTMEEMTSSGSLGWIIERNEVHPKK